MLYGQESVRAEMEAVLLFVSLNIAGRNVPTSMERPQQTGPRAPTVHGLDTIQHVWKVDNLS